MTGGAAAQACPAEWQVALGDKPELALLALTGQFTRLMTRPQVPGKVQPRADLPKLILPTLPHELRPLFRRVLYSKDVDMPPVITLLAMRGVTAHPLDWMPKRSDDDELPDIYGPWQDWLLADDAARDPLDELTAENWEDWRDTRKRSGDGLRFG